MNVLLKGELDPTKKEDLGTLLNQVRHHYQLAEEKLKLIESIELSLVIPAANQLRYAGCHLSRACVEENIEVVFRDLDKAQRHCKRAIYDSLEVGITNFLQNIKIFQDDYRLVSISSVVENYIDLSVQIETIRDYIITPRDFQREDYWTKCTDYFEQIKNITSRLEHSRPELNKLLNNHSISERRYYISLIITAIGTAAAIYALLPLFLSSDVEVVTKNNAIEESESLQAKGDQLLVDEVEVK